MAVKPPPDSASALGNGIVEIYLAVVATTFACATLGLLISALVSTSEQVMPLLIVTLMAQLVLCGGLIPVADRAGLEQLAWASPSRWGYAATASTVDVLEKRPKPPTAVAPPEGSAATVAATGASADAPAAQQTPQAQDATAGPATAPAGNAPTQDAPAAQDAQIAPDPSGDDLWVQSAGNWWLSLGMLAALAVIFTVATGWRLSRTGSGV